MHIAMQVMETTNLFQRIGKVYVKGASKYNIVPESAKERTGRSTKKHVRNKKKHLKSKKKKYKKEKKQHGKPAVTNTVLRFKDKESFAEWKRKNNKNLEFVEAVSIPVTEEIRGNLEPSKLSSSTNVVMGKIKRLDRVRVLRGETLECGIVDYVSDERIDYVVQGKKYTCDHNAVHSVSPYRGFTKGNSTNS